VAVPAPKRADFCRQREAMVAQQIVARGVRSPSVTRAMLKVPRHLFIAQDFEGSAYEDRALPIEQGQSISQPYIVALMAEALALEPQERVLEVGTGSGYAAAVLAEIAAQVYTIERHEGLALQAAARLKHHGYSNIQVRHGDGSLGWPEQAPFDGIVITASCAEIPTCLRDQLAIGGRLVAPVKAGSDHQQLKRLHRVGQGEFKEQDLGAVLFVPLIEGT
jgi:protein-L-isoaspartate(D-aspartate) O-methyltransferase